MTTRKSMTQYILPESFRCQFCFIATGLALLITLGALGCGGKETGENDGERTSERPARVVELNVLVVGDEKLGAVVKRQFSSRRNGVATLTELTWDELVEQDFKAVGENDVVIYPANCLGDLAQRKLLAVLSKDNLPPEVANRKSILFSDRDAAVSWAEQTVAMSMGQTHWMLLCRADALTAAGVGVPETWKQFSRLAKNIREAPDEYSGPRAFGVPLAGEWASHALAVRVSSAIRQPGKYSSFFDVDSMEPMIDSSPFQVSLADWRADLFAEGDDKLTPKTPSEVFADYADGKLAVAIVPLNKFWSVAQEGTEFPETTLASVPAWSSYYDRSRDIWKTQTVDGVVPVPLIQSSGMLCSVSATSKKTRDSIDTISWLTSKQITSIVAIESPNAGVSLKNHLSDPRKWLGDSLPNNNATQFADVLFKQNDAKRSMSALRIPGNQQYNAVLADAVRAVIVEGADVEESLAKAKQQWQAIIDKLGAEQQLRAYRNSEGLR